MKLKLALIIYIILTLAFLVFSEIKQYNKLSDIESQLMEFQLYEVEN